MLSSAMVTVLAPNWTDRLRRSKRFESTGSLETLVNLQGGSDSRSTDHSHEVQSGVEKMFTISQAQSRAPFQCTRQRSTGWSANSGPPNVGYESKTKFVRTVSLEVKGTDIKKAEVSSTMDANPQKRNPEGGPHVRHSSMSSKPTTSSLLLSLRRLNSLSRTNQAPSEIPLKADPDVKIFSTNLSQPFSKPRKELIKSLPSSASISPKAPETEPVGSSSLSDSSARGKTIFRSSLPINKDDTPFSKLQQTTNRTQPSISLLSRRASGRERNWRDSGIGLNLMSDSHVSSSKPTQYDSNMPVASSSGWQQTGQQTSSTPVLTDTPNFQNKPNTPLIPLCNNNCDPAALSLNNNNQSLNHKVSRNCSNGTAESVSNVNLMIKPQRGGSQSVKEKHSGYTIDKGKLAKQLYESSLKKIQLKSSSFPDGQASFPSHGSLKLNGSELSNKNYQCFLTPTSPERQNSPSISSGLPHKDQKPCSSVEISRTTSLSCGSTSQTTTLGFERRYSSNPKPLQPKSVPCLVLSASRCTPDSIPTSMTPSLQTSKHPAALIRPSTIDAEPKSPKAGGILTNHSEKERKRLSLPGHGKRVKHVMWEDTENSEPTEIPAFSPLPRSRSQRLIRSPSIFSFLRSSSPNTKNTPLCTTSPKTSNLHVGKGGKYRSSSSDSADQVLKEGEQSSKSEQIGDQAVVMNQDRPVSAPRRLQRSLSLQAILFPPTDPSPAPDFSTGYKIRYSPPPYSTLISTRVEAKKATPRSPLFQNANSNYSSHAALLCHGDGDATLTTSKPLQRKPPRPSLRQNKIPSRENSFSRVSHADDINNNNCKNISQQNGQESRDSLAQKHQSSKTDPAAPRNAREEPLQHLSKIPSEDSHGTTSRSNLSSSGSSSTESRSVSDEVCNKKAKDGMMGKFRLFSAESNNEQNPKRRRFVMKKSLSTPNSGPSMSESEKVHKTNKKIDQVFNKLKQTFSTRRSEEDPAFPWKLRRASETPSFSELSDTSDATIESTRTSDGDQQLMMRDNKRRKDGEVQEPTRYTIIPTLSVQNSMTENEFFIWPDQSSPKVNQDQPKHMSDLVEVRPTNQYLLCTDTSPSQSHATTFRKSTSSSKSPFSPFSSLSTLSPYSSPDVADDNVFYSPKLQRRRESSSPCEPGEGMSRVSSRRSRASTGPPSVGPIQSQEQLSSCYADLKYGIEPGRSFSVSSVLSSRSSRPGRISTGPKFMSVGDLSEPEPAYGGEEDLNPWLSTKCDHGPMFDTQMESCFPSDGKVRSRSLPRSLTRHLAQQSSGLPLCPAAASTASTSPHRWSPNMNICHFDWDTVSPPTPPPTPPLSPHTRRMSKPPSVSSPNFPSPPAEPLDTHSPRGHLPSRGYISSLSTFEESSDSTSDTTTDDEYYLEESENEEKETEL
nr:mucin-2 isoform X2 [Doryrhamphus excisus]